MWLILVIICAKNLGFIWMGQFDDLSKILAKL